MRKILLLASLALVASTTSFGASQVDFVDICPIMRCSSSSLSLRGSVLVSADGLKECRPVQGANKGWISSSAKKSTSGALHTRVLLAADGLFAIACNGDRVQAGTLFRGTFSGPVTWKMVTGESRLSSGDTNLVVPEPGLMGLMGTGLLGLAGAIRRKVPT